MVGNVRFWTLAVFECFLICLSQGFLTESRVARNLDDRRSVSTPRIGDPCTYDDDCKVLESMCEDRQHCKCRIGFFPTQDNHECWARVGADCRSDKDCVTLSNSNCRMEHCECRSGYVPDFHNTKCLPVIYNTVDTCIQTTQCTEGLGENSECLSSRCQCTYDHHFSDRKCIRDKTLMEPCRTNSECFDKKHNTSATMECSTETHQCVCKRGLAANVDLSCGNQGDKLKQQGSSLWIGLIFIYLACYLNK